MNIGLNDTRGWTTAYNTFYSENHASSWEAESTRSAFYDVQENFEALYVWEHRSVRARMGHQISDMLLQCSFSGGTCLASNFTLLQTTKYGNCYTLQYDKFISRHSGPAYGLQLLLFLETDEYIPGVANSEGIQLVVHDQGTLPFPSEEGMGVEAGSETFISLNRVQVSRLGKPYRECTSLGSFKRKYGVTYTRRICQKFCLYMLTRQKCNCFDVRELETNMVLQRPRHLRPCENRDEITCLLNVSLEFERDSLRCGCHRPCKETDFEKTVSARAWPNKDFRRLLAVAACKHNSSACAGLSQKTSSELRNQFVKVVIYYEDLNYEKLTESPDYQIDKFLSDVGGILGLWLGLSVISMFELVHLVIEIVIYISCGRWRRKSHDIN